MSHITPALRHCIDECTNCHQVCLSTIQHCLQKGGEHARPDHIRLLAREPVPYVDLTKIRDGIAALGQSIGIDAHMGEALGDGGDTFPYRFTASGRDHPMVIHGISHLMRVLNVNIESLQTSETGENGPEQRGFRMELGLAVPREVPIVKLREFLDHLCQEMNVSYELSAM